jgi:O-antigen/teichoic acid export membrane protein
MFDAAARLKDRAIGTLKANPNIPEAIAAFAIKLVGAALSFGFSFLVARTLGASGTGSFALAQTTALVGSTVALIGLDYVLLRDMAGSVRAGDPGTARNAARTATVIVVVSSIIVGGVVAIAGASMLKATVGHGIDNGLLLLAALAVLPLAMNRIVITSVRGAGGILAAQWLEGPQAMLLAVAILAGLIATGFAIDAFGVTLLFFATSSTSAIAAGLVYAARSRDWPPATTLPVRPMLRQGWQISFIVLSRMLVDWIVLISLSLSHSVVETGQFRTAWQITSLIALIFTTFDTVSGPRIAAAWRVGEIAQIRTILRQAIKTMCVLSAPLFLAIFLFPEWLLGLFGPEFVAGASALRLLALGQLVNIVSGPLGSVLLMTGEERWSARISVASLPLLGILCVTIIPAWGLNGAAITTSLLILFRTGSQSIIVRRNFARS